MVFSSLIQLQAVAQVTAIHQQFFGRFDALIPALRIRPLIRGRVFLLRASNRAVEGFSWVPGHCG
jgi:hypothetical protein